MSEVKLLYHTWFRTGSAYTSNGVVEFLKEVQSSLPRNIRKVFFRADSGFFSGGLFDVLESFSWDYLVKVKLKNLEDLLKAMRSVKEYVEVSYLVDNNIVPVYQYVRYISSYDMDAVELHELYKQRSTRAKHGLSR